MFKQLNPRANSKSNDAIVRDELAKSMIRVDPIPESKIEGRRISSISGLLENQGDRASFEREEDNWIVGMDRMPDELEEKIMKDPACGCDNVMVWSRDPGEGNDPVQYTIYFIETKKALRAFAEILRKNGWK